MSQHSDRREYINSRAWAVKRQERLTLDGYRCRTCGHDGKVWRLTVHHVTYERFGNEDVERDLITLCTSCHNAITAAMQRQRVAVKHLHTEFESLTPEV